MYVVHNVTVLGQLTNTELFTNVSASWSVMIGRRQRGNYNCLKMRGKWFLIIRAAADQGQQPIWSWCKLLNWPHWHCFANVVKIILQSAKKKDIGFVLQDKGKLLQLRGSAKHHWHKTMEAHSLHSPKADILSSGNFSTSNINGWSE